MRIKPATARRIIKTRPFYLDLKPESPWDGFLGHFERNAERNDWAEYRFHSAPVLDRKQRQELLRSLAIFQRGETGEGRILKEIESVTYFPVDQSYRNALRLFVAEEGRHAGLLFQMIRSMGGQLTNSSGSFRLFYGFRGLLGVRFKLMVLLAAEIIGCECYDILGRYLKSCPAGKGLNRIQKDELAHLGFHCQFFHLLGRSWLKRKLYLSLYRFIAVCASITVMVEHRRTFRLCGLTTLDVAKRFRNRIRTGAQWIRNGVRLQECL